MSSSCILYPNETFVCSYVAYEPAPGLQSFINIFRSPQWIYYAQEGVRNLSEGYGNPYLYALLRYAIMPMFFAYLWSPRQQEINIFVPDAGPVTVREGAPQPEDGLDSTSRQILAQLRAHPGGLTARKLYETMKVNDGELEEFDVTGRLYTMRHSNLVWQLPGRHSSPCWSA
jgi:hypothetical protein